MPRELELKLMTSKRMDNEANARKNQIEITSGGKTINERRSEMGLPLLDTPQADMPILVSGAGMFLFSPDGLINAAQLTTAPALEGTEATAIEAPVEAEVPEEEEIAETPVTVETVKEVQAFMKWAKKGDRGRDFEFKTIEPIVAEALNQCVYDGDLDTAKALAKAYLA
jgi:hypothetical protein